MSPVDETAQLLLRDALPDPSAADAWLAQWELDQQPGEQFASFLVRSGVFATGANRTVALMAKGYVTLDARAVLAAAPPPPPISKRPPPPPPSSRRTPTLPDISSTVMLRTSTERDLPPLPDRKSGIRVGSQLGRCMLVRQLGIGASGTVYEAFHTGLGIPVAVKVLKRVADTPRLRDEARVLATLNHPNVVRVFDFDADGAYPYMVLELVAGLSLAELIKQCGGLRPDRAVGIVSQAARGLDAAARAGVVHRDVKPANILVASDGAVKVTDLGLAVLSGGGADDGIVGTVPYMAPERFHGGTKAGLAADIYALGVTLFHAVTGRLPFRGGSPMEFMVQHATAPVPAAHEFCPDVPASLSAVIARMMAKEPAGRFGSFSEFLAALSELHAISQSGVTEEWT